MIKKIIFDVDNTILDTNIDCQNAYNNFLKENTKFKFTWEDIYKTFDLFVEENKNLSIENALIFFKEKLDKDIELVDIANLLNFYSNEATLINVSTAEALKYLSEKYELIALTNWYHANQESRLDKVGILKYFSKVYGFDNLGLKPSEFVFKDACKPYDFNECLIIGDSITSDLEVSYKLGMKAIHFNPEKIKSDYECISSLNDLKEIL